MKSYEENDLSGTLKKCKIDLIHEDFSGDLQNFILLLAFVLPDGTSLRILNFITLKKVVLNSRLDKCLLEQANSRVSDLVPVNQIISLTCR